MKEIRLTIHANIPQEAIDTWHYGDIVSFIKTQLYEAVDNAVKDGLAKELLEEVVETKMENQKKILYKCDPNKNTGTLSVSARSATKQYAIQKG